MMDEDNSRCKIGLLEGENLKGHLKERGLTTLETRRLRDQIDIFTILNGYENIDRNIFSISRMEQIIYRLCKC